MLETNRTDGDLLRAFVANRDEHAFEMLVHRHSRMVVNVCRRKLGVRGEVEDAAQAVFLVLVLKASTLPNQASLAGWLHGVACNVAQRAHAAALLRSKKETYAMSQRPDLSVDTAWRDLEPLLDGELAALPTSYRVPIILHHLEGMTEEEVAKTLGCAVGTVSTRLARARSMLRQRLAHRNVAVPLAVLVAGLSHYANAGDVPAGFVTSTTQAATAAACGNSPLAGEGSSRAWDLAQGETKMLERKFTLVALCAVAALMFSVALTFVMQSAHGTPATGKLQAAETTASPEARPKPAQPSLPVQTPAVAATPKPFSDAPNGETEEARLTRWVTELADPDEAVRRNAAEHLRKAGEKGMTALEAAAQGEAEEPRLAAEKFIRLLKTETMLLKMTSEAAVAKSFQADVNMETSTLDTKIAMEGQVKVGEGNKLFAALNMNVDGKQLPVKAISNGSKVWMEATMPGMDKKFVTISTVSTLDNKSNPMSQLHALQEEYEFTDFREDVLDGEEIYVLHGKLRTDGVPRMLADAKTKMDQFEIKDGAVVNGPPIVKCVGTDAPDQGMVLSEERLETQLQKEMGKAIVYLSKKDLYVIKTEMLDKNNVVRLSWRLSNIKIGEQLDPKTFEYVPPEGAIIHEVDVPAAAETNKAAPPPPAPKEDGDF